MDLPGFGLTGPESNGDYASGAYVRFLEEFVAKLGVDRFDLGGNSLGGYIAWRYAVAHPERIHKLVLVDAGGYPIRSRPLLVFRLARTPVLSWLLAYMNPRSLVERTLRDVYADPAKVTPELIDFIPISRFALGIDGPFQRASLLWKVTTQARFEESLPPR